MCDEMILVALNCDFLGSRGAKITEPEKENPKTVLDELETVNPARAASPPLALFTVAPLTEN